MALDRPYRFDPLQNLVNVSWEEVWTYIGFNILAGANATQCQKLGGPDPTSGTLIWDVSYMTDCATGLRYDTTSVGTVKKSGGSPGEAAGATWTYPGAEFSTSSGGEVAGINEFVLPIGGPFARNTWFQPNSTPGFGATMINSYAVVTGDSPPPEYADFPGWFDSLLVTVDAWGYPGDGLDYSSGVGDAMVGFIVSPNLTGADVYDHDTWQHGSIIGSHTFDFSSISISYKGINYNAVATKYGVHGNTVNVLCRKTGP